MLKIEQLDVKERSGRYLLKDKFWTLTVPTLILAVSRAFTTLKA